MNYIIFICPKCGLARYAKEGQRTAKCLGCGYQIRINPQKVKIVAKAKNVEEAIEIVKFYKIREKQQLEFSH
jgi:DNA-directed RNA polymerase subunit M/transcription elongation factor TFIIS